MHHRILAALVFALFPGLPLMAQEMPRALLLTQDAPLAVATGLREQLQSAGYDVTDIDFAQLCDSAVVAPASVGLLALPDAARMPVLAVDSVTAFLEGGGDIVALGAPLWHTPLMEDNGQWVDRETLLTRPMPSLFENMLFTYEGGAANGWERTTNEPQSTMHYEITNDAPAPFERSLHVVIDNLSGWDTVALTQLDRPFPEDHRLTTFYAKGGPRTTSLCLEWREKDGARWIATIPLTREWRRYVLQPSDFRYWESVPGRGNTSFNPDNATRLVVGLALTHTAVPGGDHEYWVGPIGTAPVTPDHEKLLSTHAAPPLETLCPDYKFYEAREVAHVRLAEDLVSGAGVPLPVPGQLFFTPPRPGAGGFDKGRDWRWQALANAYTAEGEWRGAPLTLLVHGGGKYAGGIWLSSAIRTADWHAQPEVMQALGQAIQRMRRGLFLVDAGANFYTYFADQSMQVGARVLNTSNTAAEITARIAVAAAGVEGRNAVSSGGRTITLQPNEVGRVSFDAHLPEWPDDGCRVSAELVVGGVVVDRATHEAHVWRPKARPEFVEIKSGDFVVDGQVWRPHGVNYMPSSGTAIEDGPYFEHWIGARSYDPVIIQRDLEHVVDMGFDCVSIFIYRESMEAQNLLDLLRRCEDLGLRANLSLRPGTPMEFRWDEMRELIEYYRLKDNDTVFAYDLAWEPMFPPHDGRTEWDPQWRQWIAERYGSTEAAEQDWGFAAPRNEAGEVTNPHAQHLRQDGEWRRMTAAYRRFLDTLLYEKYGEARRLVKGIDPNHHVSFRMTIAGDPTADWGEVVPYDFAYLAGAVDILEPEGYGRLGDWDRVKPGWFTFEYGRWADAADPLLWAEAGVSAWDNSVMASTAEKLQYQADFYRLFYRMILNSGSDGIFFWWYPGGYRVGERSDYGVINLDGSDRPVTQVIREYAGAFGLTERYNPEVDTWITMDRDANARGILGIYDTVQEEFWGVIAEDKTPGLRTAGTGTTSADCSLAAVGNTEYNGSNPPKYLDGFFDVVEKAMPDGTWQRVAGGEAIDAAPGQPLALRLTVTNLGEARWLAPSGDTEGGVYVVVSGAEPFRVPIPKDLAQFETATLELRLIPAGDVLEMRFEAAGRAVFGPRFTLKMAAGN